VFFSRASLRPRSSYLCLLCSWDYRWDDLKPPPRPCLFKVLPPSNSAKLETKHFTQGPFGGHSRSRHVIIVQRRKRNFGAKCLSQNSLSLWLPNPCFSFQLCFKYTVSSKVLSCLQEPQEAGIGRKQSLIKYFPRQPFLGLRAKVVTLQSKPTCRYCLVSLLIQISSWWEQLRSNKCLTSSFHRSLTSQR
jgi:hypothetical protein